MRFWLLGELDVRAGDRAVEIRRPRLQGLLTALLTDLNKVVPADVLAERVWGERLPAHPRNALYSYVSRLRTALGEALITQRSGGYLLTADPETVDLHVFRRLLGEAGATTDDEAKAALLTRALALWRGDPYGSLDTPWFVNQREALASRRLGAQLDLADVGLRGDRPGDLVPELTALAEAHPLDERVRGQLVLALHRAGRQGDALREYDRIRRLLAEELGTDPGAALRQVHDQVLRGDPRPRPAAARPVPHQLPAAPASFVGRAALLAELDRAAETAGPVVISAIGGAGGIGKTWLALHWAAGKLAEFPDGQLYVNLRGFDPVAEPMPVSVAVRGFLHALGVDGAAVPPDPDAQLALYRSLLAGKRVLIVLDNAADSAQAAPLLPGSPTCRVLVTSRNRLGGLVAAHGARPVPLDVLSPQEARELLDRQIGPDRLDDETAAELIRLCAGLPLALGIVAARAVTSPELPPSLLAEELRDQAARLDGLDAGEAGLSLRTVFSWSLRHLTDEAAALFGLLATAPGPDIGLPAAAALAGRPPAATRKVLRALENAHLLTRTASGRYRMHDLVRLYAAERTLPGAARDDALRRVTDFYLRTSWHGHLAIEPLQTPIPLEPPLPGVEAQRFDGQSEAVRWFATEHACLTATTELAAERGWHSQVWRLAWLLNEFRARQGQLREREAAGRLALAAAEQLGDVTAQLIAYRIHASASIFAGHPEVALECLPRALALAERAGDRLQQAHLHYVLAGAREYHSKDYRAELEECQRVFELIEPDDAPRLYIRALDLVGFCHLQWSDWHQARHWLDRAAAVARKYGDPDGEAHALGNLGFVALRSGDWPSAVENLERAVEILTRIGNERHATFFLVGLGDSYRIVGREDDARRVLHDALDRYRAHPEGAQLKEVEACFLALEG
ncbi:DNA-binding SARP family transcriptional activator/tetratricopeptide (TPR) repeat protein [Amycolatopsis lexingtonensis]|uniref:DNA-binding SARP family transcriptional activator/tetratricopeptide (TPR) repeat protein n=1 Tax=Amycolatopsis lexingtonensis TaxID=218822 RepID=A0ABR9IER8_9PSEU|nr:BTAD domain-containing putative transcriptional regulator [Amycolatopsis lexingtonensis]MBE1501651.1 DNA-binding SARP family transcriptional activator/tetratricopeptide (TPR) repeat protein [Amycolatopsis lexingtonensis]